MTRSSDLLPARLRRHRGARLGPDIQDERCASASTLRWSVCTQARFGRATACKFGRGGRQGGQGDRRVFAPGWPDAAATTSAAGEVAPVCVDWRRPGLATRSVSHRRRQDVATRFPRPALEAVVFRAIEMRPQQGSLRAALEPARRAGPARSTCARTIIVTRSTVSLYGEVQKEVIASTLERDYGIRADFRETTDGVHRAPERRTAEAEQVIHAHDAYQHHRSQLAPEHIIRSAPRWRYASNPWRRGGRASSSEPDVEIRLVPLYVFHTAQGICRCRRGAATYTKH